MREDDTIPTMNKIAEILKKANCSNGSKIAILESLKIDIILNSEIVIIDGKPLKKVLK